jgi:hypothetical protein
VRNKWFYEFECSEEKDIVKATTEWIFYRGRLLNGWE